MWATKEKGEDPFERYSLRETIEGVDVYGGGELRIAWQVHGLAVWLESGPSDTDVLPRGKELRKLVISSDSVEYSPAH